MKIILDIKQVEAAISDALHQDPAYEPGRSKSSVTQFEMEIYMPWSCDTCGSEPPYGVVVADQIKCEGYCANCVEIMAKTKRIPPQSAQPPRKPPEPFYRDSGPTGFFDP